MYVKPPFDFLDSLTKEISKDGCLKTGEERLLRDLYKHTETIVKVAGTVLPVINLIGSLLEKFEDEDSDCSCICFFDEDE